VLFELVLSGIDWFLDRLRTTVNVIGDSVACAVIEKLSPGIREENEDEEEGEDGHLMETNEVVNGVRNV